MRSVSSCRFHPCRLQVLCPIVHQSYGQATHPSTITATNLRLFVAATDTISSGLVILFPFNPSTMPCMPSTAPPQDHQHAYRGDQVRRTPYLLQPTTQPPITTTAHHQYQTATTTSTTAATQGQAMRHTFMGTSAMPRI